MHRLLFVALFACVHSSLPARRLGDSMREVGERFERIGRALLVQRWELATYDTDELLEAELVWDHHRDVEPLGVSFRAHVLPDLAAAIAGRDPETAERAFAATARACNECHTAANMRFIEISTRMGATVPVVQ